MQIESTVAQILQSTTFQFERQIGNVFPQNVAQNRGELQAIGFGVKSPSRLPSSKCGEVPRFPRDLLFKGKNNNKVLKSNCSQVAS